MLITIAEYLTLNGHNREKVYNNYSIKQLFFFHKKIVNHKNNELINNATATLIAIATGNTGKIELFDKFINEIKN